MVWHAQAALSAVVSRCGASQSTAESFWDPDASRHSDASSAFHLSVDGEDTARSADVTPAAAPRPPLPPRHHAITPLQRENGETHFQVTHPCLTLELCELCIMICIAR